MLEYRETTGRINFYGRELDEEVTIPTFRKILTDLGVRQIPRNGSYTEVIFVGEEGYCRYTLEKRSFQLWDFTIGLPRKAVLKDAQSALSRRLNGTDNCLVVTEKSTRAEISPDKLKQPKTKKKPT
jgi:hypothetical protein